jgi:anti-sigma factor RsiW
MNTATHPVTPDEIMAHLDGEVMSAEAQRVEQHLAECAECALTRDQLRATSAAMASWRVPAAPLRLDAAIEQRVSNAAAQQMKVKPVRVGQRRPWVLAGGGAMAAVAAIVVIGAVLTYSTSRSARAPMTEPYVGQQSAAAPPMPQAEGIVGGNAAPEPAPAPPQEGRSDVLQALDEQPASDNKATSAGPMIARTASLAIVVKNVTSARAALDKILTQYQGYAAQLTVSTATDSAPSLQASLRIPVSDLPAALTSLRSLGQVQNETQGGEDVTQQHTDLVARLNNARETEAALRALMQRSGKMDDVLAVEEQVSNTRGQIEQMEADQQALEHRVAFASIDLQLTEVYKAQLTSSSTSVGTRMRNSFVTGIGNAGSSLLGLVTFAEEVGPVLLIWTLILGVPVALAVRRYRRVRARV